MNPPDDSAINAAHRLQDIARMRERLRVLRHRLDPVFVAQAEMALENAVSWVADEASVRAWARRLSRTDGSDL